MTRSLGRDPLSERRGSSPATSQRSIGPTPSSGLAAALLIPMFQINALLRDALLNTTEDAPFTQEMPDAV